MSATDLRNEVQKVKDIAEGIVHVSKAMKELQSGRLSNKAVLVLLSHTSGLSQKDIIKVLNGLSDLEKIYLKPEKAKGDT